MNGVVALGEVAVHGHELEADKFQAALLESAEDPSDEKPLDTVRLDEDETAFVHESSLGSVGGSGSIGWSADSDDSGEGGRSSDRRSRLMAAIAAA